MSIEPLRKGQSFAGLESSMLKERHLQHFDSQGVLLIVLGLGNLLAAIRCGATKGIMANAFRHLFSYLDHCSSDFIKGQECFASDFLNVRFTPARCGSLLYQTLATLGFLFLLIKIDFAEGFYG